MVELLGGHVTQPLYLSMEDVQGLLNVVCEVLGRIVNLQEEEMSKTIRHPLSLQTRATPLLGPLLPVFQPEWATLKRRFASKPTPWSLGLS